MTKKNQPPTVVRCALYTRKSTEEGLEQEFNSLDAQRESGEAYIKSQAHEGWTCLPDKYDDGGYTGGNMDRPGMQRLLVDIEAGKVDCVVVYKVDRLSRSLLDFAKVMERFEKHGVSFVSVTQHFNTSTSMGRLILNVLLSFAQFERELVSERTRDKIAATRRKGKWCGGMPVLGYDVDAKTTKLLVNADEKECVREIFRLYLEHESLIATVQELAKRGWCTKRWTTRKNKVRGGKPFAKNALHQLLTNPVYIGKVRYKDEIHDGEHVGIVDPAVFQRVQTLLQRNRVSGGADVRNRYGALLKGILNCAPCGCRMSHAYTVKGQRRYRYYTCGRAQSRGWDTCPSKSVPAAEIERFVVEQIRCIGRDERLVAETVRQAQRQTDASTRQLATERDALQRELKRHHAELQRLAGNSSKLADLADLQDRIRAAERRSSEVAVELAQLEQTRVDPRDVATALAQFDPVWDALSPREQARVIQLLVERVDYDGAQGNISITFHPTGIRSLAAEVGNKGEAA